VPLFEFAIKGVLGHHDLNTTEGQLAALDEAAPILAKIKDKGLRARYAVNLDRWLGLMDEEFVMARVRAHAGDTRPGSRSPRDPGGAGNRGTRGRPREPQVPDQDTETGNGHHGSFGREHEEIPYDLGDPVVQLERQVLQLAVQRPGLCGPEFDALGADAFTVPVHQAVFTLIGACGGTAGVRGSARDWAARLREEAPNERTQAFVTGLAVEPPVIAGEPDARYADVILARIGELAVSREINAVKARLQRMNPVEEQAGYNRMFGDLVALETRRRGLLDRAAGG
jgi:DNA primase